MSPRDSAAPVEPHHSPDCEIISNGPAETALLVLSRSVASPAFFFSHLLLSCLIFDVFLSCLEA